MQITIKRGENPNAGDVLTALVNTVFYEDGTVWEPTAEQVGALTELFGQGRGVFKPDNVVPIR
jgi:hypothetical protein